MAKMFRTWDVDQGWLLPPSLHEFVPPGHMAHFVRDTVREALDLSAIFDTYTEERGYPPDHPGMMVALLLYGYSRGLYSSHQLARACEERVDVMAVTGLNRPDFRTIADFRKRHLVALSDLFVQVLRLCRQAGLVQFSHVAVDGTKMKANASRHKAMSYGRMKTAEPALAAEVEAWLDKARKADAAEDRTLGTDRRGDETPDWMADKRRRLETIRAAKVALEAEAADPPDPDDESGPDASSGMRWQGRPLRGEDGGPPDRAQRNFPDPDSRILPTRDGFIQGYNGQIAVDAAHQVIVAHRLVTNSADSRALVPLIDDVRIHLGRKPREVSGDAGFANEANLSALKQRKITAYLAPGRARHGEANATGRRKLTKTPLLSAMAARLKRAGRRSRYRLRKQVVEPVLGQIKQARGFRLVDRAIGLGWPRERIHVIDEDLGKSGAGHCDRQGFQRLIAEIGLGNAGLVLSLDASRLARNNRDWHQLLELCSLFGVILADGERLYDPSAYHDRLLLGLSGIMSEAELHQIRMRLHQGELDLPRESGELF